MSILRGMGTAFQRLWWLPALAVCFTQAGCMSAITTAALRDALRDTVSAASEPAAAKGEEDRDALADDDATEATVSDDGPSQPAAPAEPPLSLDEAVERAVGRLSGVGQLDAATQAALLSMLEGTNPEDWPAAIDAFAASLEANRPRQPPVAATAAAMRPEPEPVEPALLDAAPALPLADRTAATETALAIAEVPLTITAIEFEPPVAAATIQTLALAPASAAALTEPAAPDGGRTEIEPEGIAPASQPTLAVANACFVSRVRAWGVVDRFPQQVFQRGQDVIVYFELESLSARESSAGHATSIDTVFRLVGTDGQQITQWKFEPVEETCHAPRRDYFARYFLRIPETAPAGACRLEFMVSDRLAGVSTQAHLDLEVTDK